MDSFTLVDGASIAILLISAILAYSRGLTRELLSIAGWIAAAFQHLFSHLVLNLLLGKFQ